ncbi:nucleic acid dioxygenase ALKBH1 [Cydia fagiglandana]|uniref:nucleic acid dioxygenase ALKBH1 n=1 Tax=Cydia fagiglandana TaxID=1458189 RepID=UPI002FEDF91F
METVDNFKSKFKYYKLNKPKPSLSEVISLVNNSNHTDKVTKVNPDNVGEDSRTDLLGLRNTEEWELYTFHNHPGLFLLKNPFTALGQRYWIRKCLEKYPRKPNKLNIDIEVLLPDWWAECFDDGACNKQLQKKLRWTTLGYHHNWDTKVYTDENRSPFPEELAELSDVVAEYVGYTGFKAEAAIVNYYHMDSTLSAHTDHSELNLEAPLFSFSFGQSAIFLIGGKDKSVEPSAILLDSGDVMIMSKEARLCYHAVPKILPAQTSPWADKEDLNKVSYSEASFKYISDKKQLVSEMNKNVEEAVWSPFQDYIQESRINMNVRQVLNERQRSLTDYHFNDS